MGKRFLMAFFCGLAMVGLGCQEDESIRRYTAPRIDNVKAAPDMTRVRLLAAIIPEGEHTWFFKLVGPREPVGEQAAAFHAFVRSVRFTKDKKDSRNPVEWQVPAGWRAQAAGSGLGRYATFKVGSTERPLELRVNRFGREAGSTLDNVNRWLDLDLGLPKIAEEALKDKVQRVEIDGHTATLIDLTGPGSRRGSSGR